MKGVCSIFLAPCFIFFQVAVIASPPPVALPVASIKKKELNIYTKYRTAANQIPLSSGPYRGMYEKKLDNSSPVFELNLGMKANCFTLLQPVNTIKVEAFDSTPCELQAVRLAYCDDSEAVPEIYWPECLYITPLWMKLKYENKFNKVTCLIGIRYRSYCGEHSCRQIYIHLIDVNDEGCRSSIQRQIDYGDYKFINFGYAEKLVFVVDSEGVIDLLKPDEVPSGCCKIISILNEEGKICSMKVEDVVVKSIKNMATYWSELIDSHEKDILVEIISSKLIESVRLLKSISLLPDGKVKGNFFKLWHEIDSACVVIYDFFVSENISLDQNASQYVKLQNVLAHPDALYEELYLPAVSTDKISSVSEPEGYVKFIQKKKNECGEFNEAVSSGFSKAFRKAEDSSVEAESPYVKKTGLQPVMLPEAGGASKERVKSDLMSRYPSPIAFPVSSLQKGLIKIFTKYTTGQMVNPFGQSSFSGMYVSWLENQQPTHETPLGFFPNDFKLDQPEQTEKIAAYDSTPAALQPVKIGYHLSQAAPPKIYWPERLYLTDLYFEDQSYDAPVYEKKTCLIGIRSRPYIEDHSCREIYIHLIDMDDETCTHSIQRQLACKDGRLNILGYAEELVIVVNSGGVINLFGADEVPEECCKIISILNHGGEKYSIKVEDNVVRSIKVMCDYWSDLVGDNESSVSVAMNSYLKISGDVILLKKIQSYSDEQIKALFFELWCEVEVVCARIYAFLVRQNISLDQDAIRYTKLHNVLMSPTDLEEKLYLYVSSAVTDVANEESAAVPLNYSSTTHDRSRWPEQAESIAEKNTLSKQCEGEKLGEKPEREIKPTPPSRYPSWVAIPVYPLQKKYIKIFTKYATDKKIKALSYGSHSGMFGNNFDNQEPVFEVTVGKPPFDFKLDQPDETEKIDAYDSTPEDLHPVQIEYRDDRAVPPKIYWPERLYVAYIFMENKKDDVFSCEQTPCLIGIRSKPYAGGYSCRQIYIHRLDMSDRRCQHAMFFYGDSEESKIKLLGLGRRFDFFIENNGSIGLADEGDIPEGGLHIMSIINSGKGGYRVEVKSIMLASIRTMCTFWSDRVKECHHLFDVDLFLKNQDLSSAINFLKKTLCSYDNEKSIKGNFFELWFQVDSACAKIHDFLRHKGISFGVNAEIYARLHNILMRPDMLIPETVDHINYIQVSESADDVYCDTHSTIADGKEVGRASEPEMYVCYQQKKLSDPPTRPSDSEEICVGNELALKAKEKNIFVMLTELKNSVQEMKRECQQYIATRKPECTELYLELDLLYVGIEGLAAQKEFLSEPAVQKMKEKLQSWVKKWNNGKRSKLKSAQSLSIK